MKQNLNLALLCATLAITGCNRDQGKAPTGQVIATVGGKEITLEDLHAETGVLNPSLNPDARKALERVALQQIVARTILADYAKAQKLDNTPQATILRRRAEQEAMVGLIQRKLTSDVPEPSREEVELFVRDHPSSFAQRRVFVVDQIIATNVPAPVAKALESYSTLAEAQQALTKAGVKWTQTVGTIDALAVDPEAAEKLANLPSGTMFISPEGGVTRVNLIRDIVTAPVTGEDATRLAREAIQNGRSGALIQRQMAAIVGQGMSKVQYNAAYKPLAPAQQPKQAQGQAGTQAGAGAR